MIYLLLGSFLCGSFVPFYPWSHERPGDLSTICDSFCFRQAKASCCHSIHIKLVGFRVADPPQRPSNNRWSIGIGDIFRLSHMFRTLKPIQIWQSIHHWPNSPSAQFFDQDQEAGWVGNHLVSGLVLDLKPAPHHPSDRPRKPSHLCGPRTCRPLPWWRPSCGCQKYSTGNGSSRGGLLEKFTKATWVFDGFWHIHENFESRYRSVLSVVQVSFELFKSIHQPIMCIDFPAPVGGTSDSPQKMLRPCMSPATCRGFPGGLRVKNFRDDRIFQKPNRNPQLFWMPCLWLMAIPTAPNRFHPNGYMTWPCTSGAPNSHSSRLGLAPGYEPRSETKRGNCLK